MKYFTKELFKIIYRGPEFTPEEKEMILNASIERIKQRYNFPTNKENFQNLKVKEFKRIFNNYVLIFDDKKNKRHIKSLTFFNCSIVEKEMDITDAKWVFDEIYKNGKKYELHALLKKDNDLINLILLCDRASITYKKDFTK